MKSRKEFLFLTDWEHYLLHYYAGQIIQGLMAANYGTDDYLRAPNARTAIRQADALVQALKEWNAKPEPETDIELT